MHGGVGGLYNGIFNNNMFIQAINSAVTITVFPYAEGIPHV